MRQRKKQFSERRKTRQNALIEGYRGERIFVRNKNRDERKQS